MDIESELELRRSLGRFATGVTVVTCCAADGRPCGITANSFSSVSLDPPLVLWNIAKVSNSLQAYLDAEYFAIHVLTAGQQYMAEHFARTDHTRFNGIEHRISEQGVPILPGVLARFDCRTREIHEGGDHHIIVGEVEAHTAKDGAPLLFFGGEYRTS
ncbi:MAG: flavin reductase [Gammaproteobacteria bacterium]|jgi:flavin reductase (DIM6/NTAB) family NADH-FMN oxidoreductase RutF|nr:flavin reductase [Gammaproteobacteria bacterium]